MGEQDKKRRKINWKLMQEEREKRRERKREDVEQKKSNM